VNPRRALVLGGFLGLAVVPAAGAYAPQVALVSPFTSARETPPFRTSAPGVETRFFGRLASTQAVTVTIDRSGRVTRVVDVDRILVARKSDYSFVVNGPIEDVRAAPGSESEPGLRTGSVVWQGFSPGRRLLAAAITLRTDAAMTALPLRIELAGSTLKFVNTTSASVRTNEAPTSAAQVARALDASRAALARDVPVSAAVVRALGPLQAVQIRGFAPLRVTGVAELPGGERRRISTAVGRRPSEVKLPDAPRSLAVMVTIPAPAAVLNAPGGGRWADLARSGRLHDGRALTRAANDRLLAAALAGQFREFLENPDPSGSTRTSYRYVLPEAAKAAVVRTEGGGSPWLAVSIAAAAAIALLGGIVFWAHS
jgi:hypothetical protein